MAAGKITAYTVRLREKLVDPLIDSRYFRNKNTVKGTLLVVKLDSIGDYILFRNFLAALKNEGPYAGYKITLCGNSWWKDLAEAYDKDIVDEFMWVDYTRLGDFGYMTALNKRLFEKGFEAAIDPTYSRTANSDLVMLRSGAAEKIAQRGSINNIDKNLKEKNDARYDRLVDSGSAGSFEFYHYRSFFENLLGKKINIERPFISESAGTGNYVVIAPGARNPVRQWSPQNFSKLAKLVHENFVPGCEFILVGAEHEWSIGEAIVKASPQTGMVNKMGMFSLPEMIRCMAGCALVIANDSGPFHAAVALGKRTVCISNGNNYGRFTPYPPEMNTESITVYSDRVEQLVKDKKNVIRFQTVESQEDINDIPVEKVAAALKQLLRKNA